jgi:hypothetical protein
MKPPRGLVPARHRGLERACGSATRAIYDCGITVGSLLAVAASVHILGIHTIKTHSRRRMFSATECLVAEPLVYPMTCPVFCVGGTAGGDRMQLDQLKSPGYRRAP